MSIHRHSHHSDPSGRQCLGELGTSANRKDARGLSSPGSSSGGSPPKGKGGDAVEPTMSTFHMTFITFIRLFRDDFLLSPF